MGINSLSLGYIAVYTNNGSGPGGLTSYSFNGATLTALAANAAISGTATQLEISYTPDGTLIVALLIPSIS